MVQESRQGYTNERRRIDEALEALDSHPLVDDLANEDSLDVRLADHGNLPPELAGREIIHP